MLFLLILCSCLSPLLFPPPNPIPPLLLHPRSIFHLFTWLSDSWSLLTLSSTPPMLATPSPPCPYHYHYPLSLCTPLYFPTSIPPFTCRRRHPYTLLHLQVILMSATINSARFSEYFGGAPVLEIPGFTYPVTDMYCEDVYVSRPFHLRPPLPPPSDICPTCPNHHSLHSLHSPSVNTALF